MLIVYKFKFELTIICFLIILRRGEEVHNVVFGKQGPAQDSHDLHDWTSMLEIVLNDSDETVCDDDNMNLIRTALSLSPHKDLTQRCCLIHLKNTSTCHLYL